MIDKIRAQDLSSLFAGFLLWIKKSCTEKRIKKLFFLTREGEFFKKVYDEIAHFQENKEQDILVDILEVSRVATFAPSINAVEIEEFIQGAVSAGFFFIYWNGSRELCREIVAISFE